MNLPLPAGLPLARRLPVPLRLEMNPMEKTGSTPLSRPIQTSGTEDSDPLSDALSLIPLDDAEATVLEGPLTGFQYVRLNVRLYPRPASHQTRQKAPLSWVLR